MSTEAPFRLDSEDDGEQYIFLCKWVCERKGPHDNCVSLNRPQDWEEEKRYAKSRPVVLGQMRHYMAENLRLGDFWEEEECDEERVTEFPEWVRVGKMTLARCKQQGDESRVFFLLKLKPAPLQLSDEEARIVFEAMRLSDNNNTAPYEGVYQMVTRLMEIFHLK